MTVYIDVLFAINGILNFLLLLATEKTTRQSTPLWRIVLGATLGAIYAVCMFFPQIEALYTFTSKIAVSFILVSVVFTIRKIKMFFKTVLFFYIISFIFGGICLGVFYLFGVGKGTVISNGIFYFNLPWRVLIFSSAGAYFIIKVLWKSAKNEKMRDYRKVEVFFEGKKVTLNALVDTGNMLKEPITSFPVIVAEFEMLMPIFSKEFTEIYTQNWLTPENILLDDSNCDIYKKLRIIPFSSLGQSQGMLLGIKPDGVKIGNCLHKDIIIGIYGSKLSENKDYNALLNPEIISAL